MHSTEVTSVEFHRATDSACWSGDCWISIDQTTLGNFNAKIMKVLDRSLVFLALVLISACSSVQSPNSSVAAPNPTLATVYFYRLHSSLGGAVGVDIKDNGIDIGTLQDGTYFVYHANPGQHAVTVTTDTTSSQNMTLQAGATYYVKAGVVREHHLFKASLGVVFDLQGQTAIQNLKRIHYQE
jgi:hypothetical protein